MKFYSDEPYLTELVDEAMKMLETESIEKVLYKISEKYYLDRYEYPVVVKAIWDRKLRKSH